MENTRTYDLLYKIIIIGDCSVGKTALLHRFVDEHFDKKYIATIGVDFRIKIINIQEKRCKLQIWDTAGQERFRSVVQSYYRGTHGVILMFDITSKETFSSIKNYLETIDNLCGVNTPKLLVGNKDDLSAEREVDFETAQKFAKSNNMKYIETSVKNNLMISKAFETLIADISQIQISSLSRPKVTMDSLINTEELIKNKSKCCG